MKKILSVFLAILILISIFSASFNTFAQSKPKDGWYTESNKKYYLVNGNYAKGFFVIGKDFYYFSKKTGALNTKRWANITVRINGTTEKHWIYSEENGILKEGWKKSKGKWYYLNPFMVDGDTCLIKRKVYVFESGGALTTKKGWFAINKKNSLGETVRKWTYVKGDGIALTGWQKIGGKWYYFNPETGYMTEDGVRSINGKVYFFNSNGSWVGTKNGWVKHYGEWYYFIKGVGARGWKKIGGKWYFLDRQSSKMYCDGPVFVANKNKTTGKIYFFESSGALTTKTGKVKFNRFDSELGIFTPCYAFVASGGVCKTGWQKIDGALYFFDNKSGEMYMDGGRCVTSGGKTAPYFFEKTGALTTNTGWQTVSNTKYDGTTLVRKYYVNTGGICRTGWQKIDGATYYFDRDGKMLNDGVFVINGHIYYFETDGRLDSSKSGFFSKNGYSYYFLNGEGKTGWLTVNNVKRYFDKTMGYMYASGSFEIDGTIYDFDGNGNATKVK